MRKRLREVHSRADLEKMYPRPHDHYRYGRGHAERVEETVRVGRLCNPTSVTDLSCGNGVIASRLVDAPVLGDLARDVNYRFYGMIEETITLIEHTDLFVCSETLEHLDDPDAVLKAIRGKCGRLLLSTPIDNWEDTNNEHYWAWDREEIEKMLGDAGFRVKEFSMVDSRTYGEPYCYGIWLCE